MLQRKITTTTRRPDGSRDVKIEYFHVPANAAGSVEASLDRGDPPSSLYMTKMEQQLLPPETGAALSRPPTPYQPSAPPSGPYGTGGYSSSSSGGGGAACAIFGVIGCVLVVVGIVVAGSQTHYHAPSPFPSPSPYYPPWTPYPTFRPWTLPPHLFPTPTASPHPTTSPDPTYSPTLSHVPTLSPYPTPSPYTWPPFLAPFYPPSHTSDRIGHQTPWPAVIDQSSSSEKQQTDERIGDDYRDTE